MGLIDEVSKQKRIAIRIVGSPWGSIVETKMQSPMVSWWRWKHGFFPDVVANKRRNYIVEILSSSKVSLLNDKNIEAEFVEYYRNLSWRKRQRILPDFIEWSPISSSNRESLEGPFTKEEIYGATKELGANPWTERVSRLIFFIKKKVLNTLKDDIKECSMIFYRIAICHDQCEPRWNPSMPYSEKDGCQKGERL